MTKSQIEYILAVERCRSFSKAADSCFVTQSTLSTIIAKFEQQTDIKLFDRKTKPISITTEGAVLIRHLKSIAREFDYLEEAIQQIKGVQSGQLTIAAIPTVAPYLFPLIIKSIAERYPKVNFTILEMTTQRIIEALQEGSIDIGIVSTPLEIKHILETPIYSEAFVLYDKRPPAQRTAAAKIDVSEIDYNKLWLLEEGHCFRNQVKKICNLRQKKTIKSNITYQSGTIESLKKFVATNQGLTLLPYSSTLDLSDTEAACVRQFNAPVPAREIGLVTHSNFVKKKLLRGLVELIHEKIGDLFKLEVSSNIIKPY